MGQTVGRIGVAGMALGVALLAGGAMAQSNTSDAPGSRRAETAHRAGEIASQPARDVGAAKVAVPLALQEAIASPYSIASTKNCTQIAGALQRLNAVLGPDFVAGAQTNENRASKIAEAGGKTVVNSLIPFRGLVREFTGAAPAQRRLNAAIDAGYARRGYLRGLQSTRRCKA